MGTDLRHCWFRGHSTVFEALLPCVQREPYCSARENIEFWAGQRFRLRAPSFTPDLPKWDDYVSWLLLMQHHGVPTRLLDWTENVLVGLYFAIRDSQNEDGELWCMNHNELNWRSADWRACFPDTPPVQYLAAAAFLKKDELASFSNALGHQKELNGPLALIPPFRFRRMAAQMSRFTIHLSKEPEEQIDFLLRGTSLVRYVIPADSKRDLARHLARLGFSHETLFHSLDSLGRTIKEEILEPDFDTLPPPRFGAPES
jgi:hypothetical protein